MTIIGSRQARWAHWLNAQVSARQIARAVSVAVLAMSAPLSPLTEIPSTSAARCADVQVAFARGTGEPPGVGAVGQAFVDSLRRRVGTNSLEVYPINYPASNEWSTGLDGIKDARAHIVSMAGSCPQTKLVLGGYSQGAAVMGFVTTAAVPDGVDPASVPKPLAPEVADHVAAIVLFGMPNARAMNFLNEPPVVIGPAYQAKAIKVCAPDDPVCSDGMNFAAHSTYADDGDMIDQGAAFAASRIDVGPSAPIPVARSPHGGFGN